jgi:hypothetical protein
MISKSNDAGPVGPVAELRTTVFRAIQDWNTAHPQPLRSHREHAAIRITQTYTDVSDAPKYAVAIECQLAGRGPLTFHGPDLSEVAEQARLTVERQLAVEIQLREENAREVADLIHKYGQCCPV